MNNRLLDRDFVQGNLLDEVRRLRERLDVLERAAWTGSVNLLSLDYPLKPDYVADSVTLNDGTSANAVADLQALLDGNTYEITEAASTPGIDLEIEFVNVVSFNWVMVRANYVGSATHAVRIQLYNNDATDYDSITTIENGIGAKQYLALVPDDDAYISSGVVTVRLYHTEAGNASHDLYVDYVGLLG